MKDVEIKLALKTILKSNPLKNLKFKLMILTTLMKYLKHMKVSLLLWTAEYLQQKVILSSYSSEMTVVHSNQQTQ